MKKNSKSPSQSVKGAKKTGKKFISYNEAQAQVQILGITSTTEYFSKYASLANL